LPGIAIGDDGLIQSSVFPTSPKGYDGQALFWARSAGFQAARRNRQHYSSE